MGNKGFTLIESLLVCSIIVVLLACFSFIKTSENLQLRFQLTEIREHLLRAQSKAITEKRIIKIESKNHSFTIDAQKISLRKNIACDLKTFYFNTSGNISKADTINCSLANQQLKLVMQLGSGRIDVKQ